MIPQLGLRRSLAARAGTKRGRFVPYVLGTGVLALSGAAALFTLYALVMREPYLGFLAVVVIGIPGGWLLRAAGSADADPSRREALAAVLLSWLFLPALGALPYALGSHMTLIDALFESVSGFTTTGATTVAEFSAVAPSLLLWRALTQWVGGIGILVLFLAVFPQLAIAGRQLFNAEVPSPNEERLTPRLRQTAAAVVGVYTGLTLACALAYAVTGMGPFDALAHALGTMAAGGFSPNDQSFAEYSAAAQWVAVVFMFLSGTSFFLVYGTLTGRRGDRLRNAEFRVYLAVQVAAGLLLAALLLGEHGVGDAIRHGLFQATSMVTSTGFASEDFRDWGQGAQAILLVLMFVGGSAGSASGGVKVLRWMMISKITTREVMRALHPRAVMPVRIGGRIIPEEALRAVAAFLTLYVGLFALTTVALVFLGADFTSAFSAAIATLGNTGPGLGAFAPIGELDHLPVVGKALLMFVMVAGRLEVVTVFVVFTPAWWQLPRRRRPAHRGADRPGPRSST